MILDSSWGWLSPREREVLSALAIFVGGFTREAAEAVAEADLAVLATLTTRSMIHRLPDAQGGSRYQVHELVRQYALSQVDDDRPIRARVGARLERRDEHEDDREGEAAVLLSPAG